MSKAREIIEEFAESPFKANVSDEDYYKELIRTSIASELDAISLYEQVLANIDDSHIQEVFQHVIGEEKDHLELFNELLKRWDTEQANKTGYTS